MTSPKHKWPFSETTTAILQASIGAFLVVVVSLAILYGTGHYATTIEILENHEIVGHYSQIEEVLISVMPIWRDHKRCYYIKYIDKKGKIIHLQVDEKTYYRFRP